MGKSEDVLSTQGDPFYAAIGRALTTWSGLEFRLCVIYAACLGDQPIGALARTFWSVHSFHNKLAMTHAAMESEFETIPELWSKWKELRKRLKELNSVRNMIAHGTLTTFVKEFNKPDLDIFFAPYYWAETSHTKAFKNIRLNPADELDIPKMRLENLIAVIDDFKSIYPLMTEVPAHVYKVKEPLRPYKATTSSEGPPSPPSTQR